MSELIYYVASTLDGFIAHEDGSFDGFAWDDEVISDFLSDQKQFDTVLMGRKTYEVGLKEGKTSPYPELRQIVFSKSMGESPDPAVELVTSDLIQFVKRLKSESDRPIWVCGGSEIATELVKAGLLDKIVIKLNPVIFGSGIPLLGLVPQHVSLKLVDHKTYGCGIVFNTYEVI